MRIFLTGASGYFGGLLAETLARLPEVEGITGIDVAEPVTPLPAKGNFLGAMGINELANVFL